MKDDTLLLKRILEATERIERYVSGKTEEEFAANEQLYDSVLMNLVVIGEEANHVSHHTKLKYSNIPWHEMVGMRNLISHDYFYVKPQIIWDTVQDSIPQLKRALEEVL